MKDIMLFLACWLFSLLFVYINFRISSWFYDREYSKYIEKINEVVN